MASQPFITITVNEQGTVAFQTNIKPAYRPQMLWMVEWTKELILKSKPDEPLLNVNGDPIASTRILKPGQACGGAS